MSEVGKHPQGTQYERRESALVCQDLWPGIGNFSDESRSNHSMIYAHKEKRVYKDLSEQDQHKVKRILFILDKFCSGNAAYHELTMGPGGEDLPRSYLIKQR